MDVSATSPAAALSQTVVLLFSSAPPATAHPARPRSAPSWCSALDRPAARPPSRTPTGTARDGAAFQYRRLRAEHFFTRVRAGAAAALRSATPGFSHVVIATDAQGTAPRYFRKLRPKPLILAISLRCAV